MIHKRPQKKTRREKKRFKKKTLVLVLLAFTIVGSFFYVMNNDYLAIEQVKISGQKTIIKNDVLNVVDDYLGGHHVFIRRDNLLFLNTHAVKKQIQATFPKIEDIDISVEGGDTLIIVIGERSAHSLWCINREYESVFDEECYFADTTGLLFARAPYFSGHVYMKLFIEPREDEVYVGTTVDAVPSFVDFFHFLDTLETSYPMSIKHVVFQDFGDVVITLNRLYTQQYNNHIPVIIYNKKTDYPTIIRDIGVVLDFDSFKKEFSENASRLDSIDVRFRNKALYTFKSDSNQ